MGAEIKLGRNGLGVELDKRKEEVKVYNYKNSTTSSILRG